MEELLNAYYADNAKKLHQLADKILCRFGGLAGKDYQDFYSVANEVFVDVMKRYNGKQAFDVFLYSCLLNRFKAEMTSRNRIKRLADRNIISIDTPVSDCEDMTVGDMIPSDFDIEAVVLEEMSSIYDDRMTAYLNSLNTIQRKILELKMEDVPVFLIKERLGLSNQQYNRQWEDLKSFGKIYILFENFHQKGHKKHSYRE